MLLHLVRHAPSEPMPDRPPHEWGLRDGAVDAVAPLLASGVLPSTAQWWSSAEPKARATAALLTDDRVRVESRLAEHMRGATWFDDPEEFRSTVRRAFEDPGHPAFDSWEPLDVTRARVVAALRQIVAAAPDVDLVAVGHGTAWTVAVAALMETPPDFDAWEAMTMPDHCSLDLEAARVVSGWSGWRD